MIRQFLATSAVLCCALTACGKPPQPEAPIEISTNAPRVPVAIVVPNYIVAASRDGNMLLRVSNVGIKGSQGGGFQTVAEIVMMDGLRKNDIAVDGIWNIARINKESYAFFNTAPGGHIRYAGIINKGEDPRIAIDERMAEPAESLALTRTVLELVRTCDVLVRDPWKNFKPAQSFIARPGDRERTVSDIDGILEIVENRLMSTSRQQVTPSPAPQSAPQGPS